MSHHPQGSIWRKWDLQVHPPLCKLYDGYKTKDGSDPLDRFCDVVEASDVWVFGITDYFTITGYETFIERFNQKYPHSEKLFLFNLELRLNETLNRELEEVNVHLLFNPNTLDKANTFLNALKVTKTTKDDRPIRCSELKTDDDFKSATVSRHAIVEAFEEVYGKRAERQDHFLLVAAANNDGLRPERGKMRKEGLCDEIDKFSDAFFGGAQNVAYYLCTDRFEDHQLVASKKPVLATSDAHSFDDLENSLGRRSTGRAEVGGKEIEIIQKDITWIKADTTYEGLKQILYEPESAERVFIGVLRPDQIEKLEEMKKTKDDKLQSLETSIRNSILARSSLLQRLKSTLNSADQSNLGGIEFGVECQIAEEDMQVTTQGINMRERTDFVENGEFKIDEADILRSGDCQYSTTNNLRVETRRTGLQTAPACR